MMFGRQKTPSIEQFAFGQDQSVADDIREKYGFDGDLLAMFSENAGPVVHKWHHYLPLYDRYFAPWRDQPLRFLEIGVSKGGSLQMWRRYFGPDATIFGIDIDPSCAQFDGQAAAVRIGSQDDPAFLRDVVAEMGGVDVILDDGSHRMDHVRQSLDVLFPLLTEGGLYMIEDMHTAYWPSYGGGLRSKANFYVEIGRLIDDMHHWYHGQAPANRERAAWLSGVHVHDSIVVLEKTKVHPPVHSVIGGRGEGTAE